MDRPGIWARVKAFTRGEQDAETLYAYKRAGAGVHAQLDAAERRRFGLAAGGKSPFALSAGVGTELACTWNAFALQTLGDEMLQADEAGDPDSVGFVPPVTFTQVHAYYAEVQRWLAYANRAEHDPGFSLPRGTLPARLPDWSPVEPCPRAHLDAMMAALGAMRLHLEAAMLELEKSTPEADAPKLGQLRGHFAQAVGAADYACTMYVPGASQALHEQVETLAKQATEDLYRVGQYLSYPDLLLTGGAQLPAGAPTGLGSFALPGQLGFDPWLMTDPNNVAALKRDPGVVKVIRDMWALDPQPAVSLHWWADIQAAEQRGDVRYARGSGGRLVGYYFCAPYAAIYEAVRPIVVGDTAIRAGQRFTIECAPEGTRVGYPFKREVVTGDFQAAALDYCDPDAPPPHDE